MIDPYGIAFGSFKTRRVRMTDAAGLFPILSDPERMKYMPEPVHTSLDQVRQTILAWRGAVLFGVHILVVEQDGMTMGLLSLNVDQHGVAIGYRFLPEAKGAARRSVAHIAKWALQYVHRVWGYCHVDNIPAQRVMTRAGAVFEGRLHKWAVFPNVSSEPADCFVYSATSSHIS